MSLQSREAPVANCVLFAIAFAYHVARGEILNSIKEKCVPIRVRMTGSMNKIFSQNA